MVTYDMEYQAVIKNLVVEEYLSCDILSEDTRL